MPKSKRNRLYLLPAPLIAALGLWLAASARAVMYSQFKVTGVSINADGATTLFTMSDGSLWGMGGNFKGQLGLDPAITLKTNLPQRIVSSDVVAVSAGGEFTLFKKSDGSLWGLGDNSVGQLGLGSGVTNTFTPQEIVASVGPFSAGDDHSLFGNVGSLWAMGGNELGQLGDGTYVNQFAPEQVFTPHGIRAGLVAFAAGGGYSLFCATMASSGTIEGMGTDEQFQLGGNSPFPETNTAIFVGSLTAIEISAGTDHSLFIGSDGSLWGLGENNFGQLGISLSTSYAASPQLVLSNGVTAISAGSADSLFLKSDGSLWGTGLSFGDTPTEIAASGVAAIAAGDQSFFFVKSDGSLWAFGFDGLGQLGDGSSNHVLAPEEIVAPLQLGIVTDGGNALLFWPADAAGYVLQSTTNLSLGEWSAVPLTPVNVGGQNLVIDSIGNQSKFYRLSKPQN